MLPILPLAMHYCGVYFHSATKPQPAKKKTNSQHKANKLQSQDSSQETPLPNSLVSENTTVAPAGDPSEKVECNGGKGGCREEGEEGPSAASSKEDGDTPSVEPAVMEESGTEENPDSAPWQGEGDVPNSKGTAQATREPSKSLLSEEKIGHRRRARKVRILVLLLAASNLLPLLYFSLIHQRGTIDVMKYLHEAIAHGNRHHLQGADSTDILILMPCHSTPFYSFLHSNVSMRFLTCEPNLNHTANYTDEADIFYRDPAKWLREEYLSTKHKLPTHVVYFSVLQASIRDFLTLQGYTRCAKFFHTHVPEGRIGSHVLVSCR